jgi:hypothetical protein
VPLRTQVIVAAASAVPTVTIGQTVATGGIGCAFPNAERVKRAALPHCPAHENLGNPSADGFVFAQVRVPTYTVPTGLWKVNA